MTAPGVASAEQAREIALLWIARSTPPPIDAATCDPTPRPPSCGVTSAPAPVDPPGTSHKVPPASVEVIAEAHVLASLDAMRVAFDGCQSRRVTRGRALPLVPVAPTVTPVVPDLVQGAEEGARRGRLIRAAALLAEAGRLLAGESAEVRERAKRALDRGVT